MWKFQVISVSKYFQQNSLNLAHGITLIQPSYDLLNERTDSSANMLAKTLTYLTILSLHVKMAYYLFLTYSLDFLHEY